MPAKTMDLLIEQGATFNLDFTWMDTVVASDGTSSNVAKDLTGCTARMQVRTGYGKDVLLEATTEDTIVANGAQVSLGADGTVAVLISATVTDLAPVYLNTAGVEKLRRRGVYDLEVEWADGRVDRVLEGKVTFSPNITR
jgi:hypothetical protein